MGKIYYFSNHNQNSSQLLLSSPPLRPPPAPHQPSVSATLTSQPPERTTTTPRSSEVPDFAREVDGALDTTDVREPHSQTRPQDSPPITEQAGCPAQDPVNRHA